MMNSNLALLGGSLLVSASLFAAPHRASETYLDADWRFSLNGGAERSVRVPHDWGVEKPFTDKVPGMVGAMEYFGEGVYRNSFRIPKEYAGWNCYLDFDGVMGETTVLVNGVKVGFNHFGYLSFRADATDALRADADVQNVEVRVSSKRAASRWYTGGGLFRRVKVGFAPKPLMVANNGLAVTTKTVGDKAEVTARVRVVGDGETHLAKTHARIYRRGSHAVVAEADGARMDGLWKHFVFKMTVPSPVLWSPENPALYEIAISVASEGQTDIYRDTFGIRTVEFRPTEGFFLNGKHTKLRGVCQHADAGALGAAGTARTWRRQVEILKAFGANAIRTTHNPPSPEMMDACDELGVMVVDEAYDMWMRFKCGKDAYSKWFPDHAFSDMAAFIRRDRNHPSVIMWSIGNEVNEQPYPDEALPIGKALTAICHFEDATRPVTMGNWMRCTITNGLADAVDVFGCNYLPDYYGEFYKANPGKGMWGSETESMVSSRGVYFFPEGSDFGTIRRPYKIGFIDNQVSSYDIYPLRKNNYPPEVEFAAQRKYPQCYGEFVWTGFDYLGEPSPWEKEARSSYYGIVDLCGFPKDRFYCYQAEWCPEKPMVHALPHWTWPGREGKVTPVHVYTTGDSAEVFVNGKSQGLKRKGDDWRLMWNEVRYEPGELKVVAYRAGKVWAETVTRTAGPAAKLVATADTTSLDGIQDLAYVTFTLVDAQGTVVPEADVRIDFRPSGAVELIGSVNGDATDRTGMQEPWKNTFHGLAQAVVRARDKRNGKGWLEASTPTGLKAMVTFDVHGVQVYDGVCTPCDAKRRSIAEDEERRDAANKARVKELESLSPEARAKCRAEMKELLTYFDNMIAAGEFPISCPYAASLRKFLK